MGCDRKGWKGTVAGGQDARGGAEGVAGKLHTGSSAALFDKNRSLIHRKAVFTGEPLALQSAERDGESSSLSSSMKFGRSSNAPISFNMDARA
jgi:hypothetical protein